MTKRTNDQTRDALFEAVNTGRCRICGGPRIGVTCGQVDCLRSWLILPAVGVGLPEVNE